MGECRGSSVPSVEPLIFAFSFDDSVAFEKRTKRLAEYDDAAMILSRFSSAIAHETGGQAARPRAFGCQVGREPLKFGPRAAAG